MAGDASYDTATFAELQAGLLPRWPMLTMRGQPEERTMIVVSSISFDVPDHVRPLVPAYEERYLLYVLALVRTPKARAIYLTSQPVLPRMLDYYLDLMGEGDRDDIRRRVFPVSVGDWSSRPLTEKVLARPRLVERLRSLVPNPDRAVLLPFVVTPLEARLACALGVPVYGPDPTLAHLGTKSGSRQAFAAAGVPHPRGVEGVGEVDDVVDGVMAMASDRPLPAAVVVKLDASVSGLGNATVDLARATDRAGVERAVRALQPEDADQDAASFLAALAASGGIVEERIDGDDFRSPSVQLRASPLGEVEVLSTHDQVLGGPTGQTYFGCRFPADPEYARLITGYAEAIGRLLAAKGVIGRFAIDFVVTRGRGGWRAWAIEINLRNGGTTHPALALLGLTEGHYDERACSFVAGGRAKHYVATDHLEHESFHRLTPDDVLDVIDEAGLGWDAATQTGIVFHMISAVAVAGRVGLTAIADSHDDADRLYQRAEAALRRAALEGSC